MAFRSRAADLLAARRGRRDPLRLPPPQYQAHASVGPVDIYGSDVAILITLLAAVAAGVLFGWGRLLQPRPLWVDRCRLLALFVVSCFWSPIEAPKTHLITAAKVIEYALLAPAAVLLFRRRVDLDRFLAVFVAWSAAASVWGLLQFLGVVSEFEGKRPGPARGVLPRPSGLRRVLRRDARDRVSPPSRSHERRRLARSRSPRARSA